MVYLFIFQYPTTPERTTLYTTVASFTGMH